MKASQDTIEVPTGKNRSSFREFHVSSCPEYRRMSAMQYYYNENAFGFTSQYCLGGFDLADERRPEKFAAQPRSAS